MLSVREFGGEGSDMGLSAVRNGHSSSDRIAPLAAIYGDPANRGLAKRDMQHTSNNKKKGTTS